MDNDEIRELLGILQETDVTELQLEREGVKVRIRRDRLFSGVESVPIPGEHGTDMPRGFGEADAGRDEARSRTITSPIVGTFYRSPSPEAESFVQIGDGIKKGQVLCIIEAMKLMNEIESDTDGKVTKILVENGQAVEYGEPLFLVDPT